MEIVVCSRIPPKLYPDFLKRNLYGVLVQPVFKVIEASVKSSVIHNIYVNYNGTLGALFKTLVKQRETSGQ